MQIDDRSTRRPRRWLIEFPRLVPVTIFAAILAITCLSIYAIESGEADRDEAELRDTARAIGSALDRRGNASTSYLRAGAALFSNQDSVSPTQFRRFVSELRLDANYRSGEGIGWAEAVPPGAVEEFQLRVESAGGLVPRVYPEPEAGTQQLVPVTYLFPDTMRNRRAIGYDMYSEPTRRAAMDEALRFIRPTATGKVVLVQEGQGDAPGFLIYMPVFEGGLANTRRLKGYIYSPFNGEDFLSSAQQLTGRGSAGVRLYDSTVAQENLLAEIEPGQASGHTVEQEVNIANRPMILQVEASGRASLSNLSMVTLIFGLLLGGLLAVVARLITQQAMEDQASLEWFSEQNSIRNSLTRELNHRVKNTLANVLSIIALTRRREGSVDSFADSLDGRIRALSATHDLLTRSEWGTTPIKDVVQAELSPYASGSDQEVELLGPDIHLAPNDALSLGLAVHELATNASKYGALSVPGGKVRVEWIQADKHTVRIDWIESGGPPVAQDKRKRGFGTELIQKIVAHELRHPVKLDFAESGVTCTLFVPVRERGEFAMRARS